MAQPLQPIYINKFIAGLVTQGRSALVTPITYAGLQGISRTDALITGSNFEITNNKTLARRPGYPTFCSSTFGSSEWPLNFFSWRKNDGTVTTFVDTQTNVYKFSAPSTLTSIFTKTGGAGQTNFQNVGNILYFVNGVDRKKYDGTTVTNDGIIAPVTNPTIAFPSGSLSPTSGYIYCYAFRNSSTGTVSSASPFSPTTGKQTSKNFTLTGDRSTDPQCDKVWIYRTTDGGGTVTTSGNSAMLFLTEIANPVSGTWSFTDSSPDSSLNTQIVAGINHLFDPAPAGLSNVTFYQGRMWGTVGNLLYFAAGADVLLSSGVPEEAWPPANVFKLPGNITALMPTAAGLMVHTSDSISIVLGGPDTASYYVQIWMNNIGVLSQNAVSTDGEVLFMYTTNRMFIALDGTGSRTPIGFSVGDILLNSFDPAKVYVTAHRSGTDQGVFISDGSTNVLRYSMDGQAWSPLGAVVGGVGAIQSLETSSGVYTLCAGRATGSGSILGRSLTSFVDGASAYTASLTIGSLTLATPGSGIPELYPVESIVLDRMPVGTDATVKVLMNDISGTFTALSDPKPDPPELVASTGVISKRWYVSSSTATQLVRHMQIQISFVAEAFQNELLAVTVQPQH